MAKTFPAFHDDPDRAAVLSVVNALSRPVVLGVDPQLLNFRLRQLQPDHDFREAIAALLDEGWLEQEQHSRKLRFSALGYQRVIERQALVVETATADVADRDSQQAPSEFLLRQRVLAIYAEDEAEAGSSLSAEQINQYWSAAGFRAEELRHALDILLRDGYLRLRRFGRTRFRLQQGGARYLAGRSPPAALQALAPEACRADCNRHSVADEALLIYASHVFRLRKALAPRSLSFGELDYQLEALELPAYLRFHAADLLYRYQYAELHDDGSLQFTLSERGMQLVNDNDSEMLRWTANMSLASVRGAKPSAGSA